MLHSPATVGGALDAATLLEAWEGGAGLMPAARALALLATLHPERSAEAWATVAIGERNARLLGLRARLFGDQLETVETCPQCGEYLEVRFGIGDIAGASGAAESAAGGEGQWAGYRVAYRVPTSADLIAAAAAGRAMGRTTLLRRCVDAARDDGSPVDATALPDDVVQAVIDAMTRADPLADLQVSVQCAACGHAWMTAFDVVTHLWDEVEEHAGRLLLDIHRLATAYGWTEREILGLAPQRRQLYCDMVGS